MNLSIMRSIHAKSLRAQGLWPRGHIGIQAMILLMIINRDLEID